MNPASNLSAGARCFRHLPLLATIAISMPVFADNWPQWRGPAGTGVSAEKNLPLHWGTNENVRWRVPLPERGNSTPVIWGAKVFVTQAIETDGQRTLMCFDKASGKQLWKAAVTYKEKEPTHPTNPYCSASPVTDGQVVIASF